MQVEIKEKKEHITLKKSKNDGQDCVFFIFTKCIIYSVKSDVNIEIIGI